MKGDTRVGLGRSPVSHANNRIMLIADAEAVC